VLAHALGVRQHLLAHFGFPFRIDLDNSGRSFQQRLARILGLLEIRRVVLALAHLHRDAAAWFGVRHVDAVLAHALDVVEHRLLGVGARWIADRDAPSRRGDGIVGRGIARPRAAVAVTAAAGREGRHRGERGEEHGWSPMFHCPTVPIDA